MKKIKHYLLILLLIPMSIAAQNSSDKNLEALKNMEIMNAIYKNLDLLYVDTLNPKKLFGTGINAMLGSLDPYTEYYPEDETQLLKRFISGKYGGIGALIRYNQAIKNTVIDEPYANMPSSEVGLKKGDIILSIDDKTMIGKDNAYVSENLRGEPGSTFLLKVRRPSTNKVMTFKIKRRNIQMPAIPYYGMQHGNIGYINLYQFYEGCAKEVRQAFVELKKAGAKSLVLDLRGNGGGSEQEAVDLVNIFLPKDITVVTNKGKVKKANIAFKTRLQPVDTIIPLVVLVNHSSASASEITSGALQDLDRAVVLGSKTYGKGLVQTTTQLPYNGNIKLTTAHYYIPSGRCIQAVNYNQSRGKLGEQQPDSLRKTFFTRNGRPVKDGGGITPDVIILPDTMANISAYLQAGDSTETMLNYVVNYIASHKTIASPATFELSDNDFNVFKQQVIANKFTYDHGTENILKELEKIARFEGYYEDAKNEFEALKKKLQHNVAKDLDLHKEEIKQLISSDIIAAYYYQAGSIEYRLRQDKQMNEAKRLLQSPQEYVKLLQPKATKQ